MIFQIVTVYFDFKAFWREKYFLVKIVNGIGMCSVIWSIIKSVFKAFIKFFSRYFNKKCWM